MIGFFGDVAAWFMNPANWQGTGGVPNRIFEHVQLSALAIVCAMAVAIPLGVWLGHAGRGGFLAINVVNVGRALPTLAIMAVATSLTLRWGFGLAFAFWSTWIAMVLLALPPMLTNSYTAIRGVDRQAVAAARGMGLREWEVLRAVELPLAAPIISAATRVSAVQVVATASLGAIIGWGGLGRYLVDGLATRNFVLAFNGALLIALLAVATELCLSAAERVVLPRGVKHISHTEAEAMISRAT